MEGKKEEGIRKGPWKAEEDEVLINHVSKYGPRDWSSIRSKGLLQRTGKSCRLRWVNKLRPNLKNGCKFSLEEERVVIELQAEFGNKWARIATYLPGRTDNDVKNFWSSRQKRLARILLTSSTPYSKPHKTKTQVPASHALHILEGRGFSSLSKGEISSKIVSCSSSSNENSEIIKMVSLPDLIKLKLVSFEQDLICQPQAIDQAEKKLCIDSQPLVPFLPTTIQPQLDLGFTSEKSESQELLARLDPYYDMFGPLLDPKLENGAELPFGIPLIEPVESCRSGGQPEFDDLPTPDCFFDDFPVDMFDQIEPLPSPSDL